MDPGGVTILNGNALIHPARTPACRYDKVTHTSDSFDLIEKYQLKLLQAGLCYVDDTPQVGLQPDTLALITSDRDAMRSPEHQHGPNHLGL